MSNATYRWRRANGLCGHCGCPPMPGARCCGRCQGKQRQRDRERYSRYQSAGLCVRCGQRAPVAGYTTCATCYTPRPREVAHAT